MDAFACPPDCGWCCTHLRREVPREEAAATRAWRAVMREQGVYHCRDAVATGLSLTPAEADALRRRAEERGLRHRLHPRTFLLETRRRVAVVLDWHFPHAECPFYNNYKCTVYEDRPLVCRAFPVMVGAPAWSLHPQCPRSEPTLAARDAGALRLGPFLRVESAARRGIERRHAAMDEAAFALLDAPGARFAKGLDAAEAERRAKRYRALSPDAYRALVEA